VCLNFELIFFYRVEENLLKYIKNLLTDFEKNGKNFYKLKKLYNPFKFKKLKNWKNKKAKKNYFCEIHAKRSAPKWTSEKMGIGQRQIDP